VLVDSLFDKPVIHFKENIKVLSIGSWGCNLRCLGCQNDALSWTTSGKELGSLDLGPEAVVKMALESQCRGICYTYNEPAILLEAVEDIGRSARKAGLYNIFVTNSTLTVDSTRRIAAVIDAVAADIKSMKDDFYYDYCGAAGISEVAEKVLQCIKTFHDSGTHVEIRTNVIHGTNDQEENFRSISHWIRTNLGKQVPWHITKFFPAYKLSHLSPVPTQVMLKAQHIGLDEGLEYVHTYFSKGCDCAGEMCMIDENAARGQFKIKSCCD